MKTKTANSPRMGSIVTDTKLQELIAAREKLEEKIALRESDIQEELRAKIDGMIEQYGYSIRDLYPTRGAKTSRTRARDTKASAGLYQDPSNPDNTWGGRGRMPGWLAAKVSAGFNVNEFKVGG